MPQPLIKLDNVSWAYRRAKTWALKNINVEIGEGECIAVMGESGAGKTTFCRLLNGIIPHSLSGKLLGRVLVDGVLTQDSSVAELAGKVGMVLEDPETQLVTARVKDEVAFGLENLLLPPGEIRARVKQALETAGLGGYADFSPSALSGGQKQRLAIAAALVMAARALVLDEPTSQLDPAGSKEVLSFIREIRRQRGLTVIMATHNSEEVCEFADRVCLLKNGTVAALDTPERIFSNGELLNDHCVRLPQVSELALCMKKNGEELPFFPLLPGEAKAAVLAWFKTGPNGDKH
ncbi:MAG: ATP-binding cassette domain-containing protein [Treponema sp.]|jgi:energy-coupling factor transporter ATP-binding protein EcfA2|nr:ATP-binding cassette domain-containing protein [Treponema sp.]